MTNFKKGDLVRCPRNFGGSGRVVSWGATYLVLEVQENGLAVIDDNTFRWFLEFSPKDWGSAWGPRKVESEQVAL